MTNANLARRPSPLLAPDVRILYLSDDPECVRRQIGGETVTLDRASPLRNDISTDEITPITVMNHIDEQLARFPHVGFMAGGQRPIGEGDIGGGGFQVIVGGRRYGKGSSREHSPLAERMAGVRVVFAESFERIYRQNADNVGLVTSTDMTLLKRLEGGEAVTIDDLTADRDPTAAAILREGGLLEYGKRHLRSVEPAALRADAVSRTLAEKILERHLLQPDGVPNGVKTGSSAFVRADFRFIIEFYTGMAAELLHSAFGLPLPLIDPSTIIGFAEHFSYIDDSPAHRDGGRLAGIKNLHSLHDRFVKENGLRDYGNLPGRGSVGICHSIMTERHALPGQVVVGTDSHTPHAGAVGCLAFGVGATEMANAMVTGAVRMTVPETILIVLSGQKPIGVTAKDMVLALLADPLIRSGIGLGRVFEFGGVAVAALSIDERATLTNMAAELGGFTGIVGPDAETVRFLKERRGIDFVIEPWMQSDPGAPYCATIEIDCAALSPMVARPGDPGNGVPLSTLTEPVAIDIAYGGSCTGGKQADFDDYHRVLQRALAAGQRVAPGVTLYLQFGSGGVGDYCARMGYLETFERVGAEILQPACGACANLGPGASMRADQVTVSAQNRNFPGRSGPGQVWLASPATVAASAVAGRLCSAAELFTKLDESVV